MRNTHAPGGYAMSSMKSARMQDHFAELTDPRRRKVTYPLINVVVIAICAAYLEQVLFGE